MYSFQNVGVAIVCITVHGKIDITVSPLGVFVDNPFIFSKFTNPDQELITNCSIHLILILYVMYVYVFISACQVEDRQHQ